MWGPHRTNDPISWGNALPNHADIAATTMGNRAQVKLLPFLPTNDLAFLKDMALLQETADVKKHNVVFPWM